MRPPDGMFFYGPPENLEAIEPRIRPICARINQSGWLWTVESCEGHAEENPVGDVGWGDDKPMIRFCCHVTHAGHLLFLCRRVTDFLQGGGVVVMYPGLKTAGDWVDVITYIDGIAPTNVRRDGYAQLAEWANEINPERS